MACGRCGQDGEPGDGRADPPGEPSAGCLLSAGAELPAGAAANRSGGRPERRQELGARELRGQVSAGAGWGVATYSGPWSPMGIWGCCGLGVGAERRGTGERAGSSAAGILCPPRGVALLSALHPAIQSHFLRVLLPGVGEGCTLGSTSPATHASPGQPDAQRAGTSQSLVLCVPGFTSLLSLSTSPGACWAVGFIPLPPPLPRRCSAPLSCLLFETVVACP